METFIITDYTLDFFYDLTFNKTEFYKNLKNCIIFGIIYKNISIKRILKIHRKTIINILENFYYLVTRRRYA